MRVQCCYRLSPMGSVIHDLFDTSTKDLVKNKHLLVHNALRDEKFFPEEYTKCELKDDHQMVEAALLSSPDYVFCLEWSNRQYDCYTLSGRCDCKKVPEEEPYVNYSRMVLDISDYADCGVEVTEYVQLRYGIRSIFRIVCYGGYIYCAKGTFKLSDSIYSRLREFRPDYSIYKQLRDGSQYFGYLFLDTAYGLLSQDIKTGELIITEVPYGNKI